MDSTRMLLLCLLFIRCSRWTSSHEVPAKRPNIIVYLVDDMGWNDVGYHGLTDIPTPNIDFLASNSIILNNYYTHHVCSPSRSALMSGKLATSTGLQHDVLIDSQPVGLPLNLKIFPEYLKELGYSSHVVGKWHLGFYKEEYIPKRRGFLSHYGFWNGLSDFFEHYTTTDDPRKAYSGIPCNDTRDQIVFPGYNFVDGLQQLDTRGEYLTELFTQRAREIIQNQPKNEPLFLYLAHHGVHRGNFDAPVRAPRDITNRFTNLKNDSTRQNFAGALTAIDMSLGDIMKELEKKEILNNTLILFSTDNGAPEFGQNTRSGGSNYPLRGHKNTIWEGGLRGVGFIFNGRSSDKRYVYDGLMHIVDILPTLYTAAGGKQNIIEKNKLDGVDMWNAIQSKASSPRKTVLLQADSIDKVKAYRSGDYKIIVGKVPTRFSEYLRYTGRGPPSPGVQTQGSNTEQVLKRLFGQSVNLERTTIRIDCGKGSVPCFPERSPCLFNLKEDPCEMRNLAHKQPKTLHRLRKELKKQNYVHPNYPKFKYTANPDYHGGYWVNWGESRYKVDVPTC